MPRRLPDPDAGEPPPPAAPSHWADTQIMQRPVLLDGPPVLMCAIRRAAADGTGPDAAARLAATLVLIGLELTVLAEQGQLHQVDAADTELRTRQRLDALAAEGSPYARRELKRHRPPRRRSTIGLFRRQAATLLRGTGPPPVLPGAERIAVADLYEQARAGP